MAKKAQPPATPARRAADQPKTRDRKPRPTDHKKAVGERLRWIRELIDWNRTRIARQYGVDHTAWDKWERGEVYPNPIVMARFATDYGFTTDWLYRGLVMAGWDEELRLALVAEHPQVMPDRQTPSGHGKPRRSPPREEEGPPQDEPEPPRPTGAPPRRYAGEPGRDRARSEQHRHRPPPAPNRRRRSAELAGSPEVRRHARGGSSDNL